MSILKSNKTSGSNTIAHKTLTSSRNSSIIASVALKHNMNNKTIVNNIGARTANIARQKPRTLMK